MDAYIKFQFTRFMSEDRSRRHSVLPSHMSKRREVIIGLNKVI